MSDEAISAVELAALGDPRVRAAIGAAKAGNRGELRVATTIRLPGRLHAKIAAAAGESGVTPAAFIVAVLDRAMQLGWRAEKRPAAEVVEPG